LGIEEQYESVLRGVNGKELIETDALGRTIKKIGEKQPFSGRDVRLTLDLRLQKLVKDAFLDKEKGAVVASDPSTGEILAVYSSPSFDPNLFTMPQTVESSKALKNILESKESPLFNRAIGGVYPSGSTFKIVTAAAGLETGKISAKTEIEDVGEIKIGPYRFPNWYFLQYGGKDGMVNVVRALKRSNDIFFYKAGEMVGLDSLVLMARKFGLSEKTGIDFPHESKGLMPDEEWKKKTIGDNWYLGDTYHLAIGQGYLLVTPLQINLMTNVIANGGKLCRPHLRLNDQSDSNASDVLCWDIGLKTETISLIKEGMKEACLEGGTAWPFFDFKIQSLTSQETEKISVGCKTGTAEFGDPNNNTHGWFTVFAPFEKPKITMTILVEGAGEGSNVAAPVAKKVLSEWLRSN
jgi:penicillin-binding protein 2